MDADDLYCSELPNIPAYKKPYLKVVIGEFDEIHSI
jgi:hypothetical protein